MAAGLRRIYEVELRVDGVPPFIARFEGILATGPSRVSVPAGETVSWYTSQSTPSTEHKTAFCLLYSDVEGVEWYPNGREATGNVAFDETHRRALRPLEFYTGIGFKPAALGATSGYLTLVNPTSHDAVVTILYVRVGA